KFKNVTNGIAYRRWLYQSNPGLTNLLKDVIGNKFLKDASELSKFAKYKDDPAVCGKLADIKKENKIKFSKYVKAVSKVDIDPDTIFDVQVKRLHEYKRQHLNLLNIISEYNALIENPDMDFVPKTYIFAAKAAPGYHLAKQIIKAIWSISEEIRRNPKISEKLSVYFLEDYSVTLSELLMPAADVSEQISLAGTEASGTGNMKLMLNGAVTLGTLDGANIEIKDAVGDENIFIFGMKADEVVARKGSYVPVDVYNSDEVLRNAVNRLEYGINSWAFKEISDNLKQKDPYMVLADFNSYRNTQIKLSETYLDQDKWLSMSLMNIASSGMFSADRAVNDYARDIWHLN
ncbi:MAG: glycogen/starch/alpha-glucan phosphorylase, partial [Ruminococcus sp.]|nr:glycogen/starch/alpha-glucan phosphorylase [Ruminococcus sp.]